MSLIRRCLFAVLLAALHTGSPAAQTVDETLRESTVPPLVMPGETDRRQPLNDRDMRRLQRFLVARQQPADDGFEPLSELPPDERLPAAPMLVGAYIFVVLALFGYLLSISRRLSSVKQEIGRLESDMKRTTRP